MAIVLASKPGLTSASALSIPKEWDAVWFRGFINNLLKGGDVRNAVGANGVSVTGNIASPYATIGFGTGPITITGTGAAVGAAPLTLVGTSASGPYNLVFTSPNTTPAGSAFLGFSPAGAAQLGTISATAIQFITSGSIRATISAAGNVIVNAPASGITLTSTGTVNGAAIFNATDGTINLSSWTITGAAQIGTAQAHGLQLLTNSLTRIAITNAGAVTINAPSGGVTPLTAIGGVNSRTITAQLAATGSASIAFTATDGGSTSNTLLEVQTANFSSTGTAAPVLTANKPGAGTAVLGWLRVSLNGSNGWVPVWAN